MIRSYDEVALVDRLGSLDPVHRTAFALSCGQRLLPLYQRFAERSAPAAADRWLGVADRLWAVL